MIARNEKRTEAKNRMNDTGTRNLGDLIDHDKDAGKIALIDCADWNNPVQYSYAEFDELVRACARGLARRGLRPGHCVALAARNCAPFLAL